jgi:putative spermidine/putrescine transport system ATP-binding protein
VSATTLEARGLAKRYGSTFAVESVSHVFAPGSTTAIVGPSGSGKSTLLGILAGLVAPDAGSVLCDRQDITAVAPEHRGFGIVFQSYALFPHMTVQQNAEFGLRVRGAGADTRAKAAGRVLDMLQLGHLSDRPVTALSGGEQQRVALARALAFEPRVLMLDEPLSALDAMLRRTLRVELRRLLSELQITTLYVTHDQTEAMSIGDEVVLMHRGRIEQAGPPRELYARPRTWFAAQFLGTPSLVAGRGIEDAGGAWLELPFARIPKGLGATTGACWAVLRPEALAVVPSGRGHFDATVESHAFLGDRTRLQVIAAGEELAVDTPGALEPRRGERVGIEISAETLWTVPREDP